MNTQIQSNVLKCLKLIFSHFVQRKIHYQALLAKRIFVRCYAVYYIFFGVFRSGVVCDKSCKVTNRWEKR
jgi:hypothetical protein